MDHQKQGIEDFQRALSLSPPPMGSASGRSSCSTSPEFEFWMARNPSFPHSNLLSADELFADGVLLPLHLVPSQHLQDPPDPNPQPLPTSAPVVDSDPCPRPKAERQPKPESQTQMLGLDLGPKLVSEPPNSSVAGAALTGGSKRWKDIFRKSDRKVLGEEREKEKKRERKSGGGVVSSAELNINIWPFSRSRSSGNGGNRPKMAAGTVRQVSSAPCSRSNSAGESKSRKWPSSPSRAGGVHLGRSSPVWQVRRGVSAGGRRSEPVVLNAAEKWLRKEGNEARGSKVPSVISGGEAGGGAKGKGLSLNVPMCIGYRHHLSCRSNENRAIGGVAAANSAASGGAGGRVGGGGSSEDGGRGSNIFNMRSLFRKKVY